eukprot:TRINITY_DN1248_c0_g1_i1.p1 TRINITY_DN1248_c0_g1~~TRINITY_DN1248_c0_g1_i1.p1  ORF type:complete len:479 (-),score=173.27 TRINITY_DN1248_c0_g1_i1:169-1605(-)
MSIKNIFFKQYFETNDDCQRLRTETLKGKFHICPLRSISWMVFLGCLEGVVEDWKDQLNRHRTHYEALRSQFMVDPGSSKDFDPNIHNPLSQDESSVWNQHFQNQDLKKEINQDIVRTYPEKDFFQEQKVREVMLNVLFIFARNNPTVSYRQGMHEILAPLLYVLHSEKVPKSEVDSNELWSIILDEYYLEHNAFLLFDGIMQNVKHWFVTSGTVSRVIGDDTQAGLPSNPVVRKSHYIFHVLLKEKDPQLYEHLETLQIEPQLYALRWIRLLFGREFHLDDLINLWDGLFAHSRTLELVDHICVAMLIYIREQLIGSDNPTCLKRLFKYPPVEDVQSFITKAINLMNKIGADIPNPNLNSNPNLNLNLNTNTTTITTATNTNQSLNQIKKSQQTNTNIAKPEDLIQTIDQLTKKQSHCAERLERIVFVIQKELLTSPNSTLTDSMLLALAELKQVKDILSGLLPDDMTPLPLKNSKN